MLGSFCCLNFYKKDDDRITSKYLDNYLSWFKFLDDNGFDDTEKNIKEMLIASCLYRVSETYKSLRLSEFSV